MRLVPQLIRDILLEECQRCGGVWIEATTFDRLVQRREQQAAVIAETGPQLERGAPNAAHPLQPIHRVQYLPCPDCRQLMNRKNFAHISGVIIDVCKVHGVWFDRNELGQVIQFVMNGGLTSARRAERETLERQLQRLAAGAAGGASDERGESRLLHELVQVFRGWLR